MKLVVLGIEVELEEIQPRYYYLSIVNAEENSGIAEAVIASELLHNEQYQLDAEAIGFSYMHICGKIKNHVTNGYSSANVHKNVYTFELHKNPDELKKSLFNLLSQDRKSNLQILIP